MTEWNSELDVFIVTLHMLWSLKQMMDCGEIAGLAFGTLGGFLRDKVA